MWSLELYTNAAEDLKTTKAEILKHQHSTTAEVAAPVLGGSRAGQGRR